ncbi:MMPL family transporter [Nocardia asteroides]|uniref:Membrane transport protein MMPL domain-containing protein n=1 Tax=Nocardia asteroides NBRC 15531 TaxID=1110697 RepID=U5EIU7_NOCAS|nr:MMPL family transporter [Nocardia asteroides]UGT47091.1 MMPL family transporter [Nocardia asteroides]GAD87190.1 hypothetical protein NCAST_34_03200 [Nocardia asteroides NBRC 15531]SFM79823.1 putative drug exporter of the RND superfamily [Nocardia asteroides]VEG34032.1 Predicted exporter [Nocardia asteroides]
MRAAAAALTARNIEGVTGIQVTPPSENRLVQVIAVQMTKTTDAADKTQGEAVRDLREQLREQVRDTGLRAGITGTAAQTLDQTEQGEKGMAIIGIATIVLILVLLLVIFRSPVIALLPVITIGAISSMVGGLIAMNHDYRIVFPVAAIVIMLVLALLLRSLVAPWYLMASVFVGFAATLGATVLVFRHLQGEHGLIFTLPVIMYRSSSRSAPTTTS